MGDDEDEHDSPVEGQPEKVKKPKKVYCYISPKVGDQCLSSQHHECFFVFFSPPHFYVNLNFALFQQLSVKEFYLKIIPWRLFTFRVCPGTKVSADLFQDSTFLNTWED